MNTYFVLLQRRQRESQKKGGPVEDFSDVTEAVVLEKAKIFRDEPKNRPSTAARVRAAEDLRHELFKAVENSDKEQVYMKC